MIDQVEVLTAITWSITYKEVISTSSSHCYILSSAAAGESQQKKNEEALEVQTLGLEGKLKWTQVELEVGHVTACY